MDESNDLYNPTKASPDNNFYIFYMYAYNIHVCINTLVDIFFYLSSSKSYMQMGGKKEKRFRI